VREITFTSEQRNWILAILIPRVAPPPFYGTDHAGRTIGNAAFILDEHTKMSEWISVEDELPKHMRYCLVCVRGFVEMARLSPEEKPRWTDFLGRQLYEVSHWMPLPKPPEQE